LKTKRVVIFTDGASRGNPGPSAIGAIIKDEQGRLIAAISQPIGQATNNQAEYKALIAALERAIRLGLLEIDIRSDSELLVKQIKGEYRVKAILIKPLYQKANELLALLRDYTITCIPREQNSAADKLANMAFK
jgi:ribonuclease HI